MYEKEQIVKILLAHEMLSPAQLREADEEVKKTGLSFSKALEKTGMINEVQLTQLIAQDAGIPFLDLLQYSISAEVIKLIPQKIARRYKLIPLFKVRDILTVAMTDPKDITVLDKLQQVSGVKDIEAVISTEEAILEAIEKYYAEGEKIKDVLKGVKDRGARVDQGMETKGAPIIKIVDILIAEAVKSRASDIHLEPGKDILRVRYRIDGVLHEISTFPRDLQGAIASRIKLMANMDIAESRLPQDGKIGVKVENKDLDIRVSSFPTVSGENIVMRILDKASLVMGLSQLGFLKEDLVKYEQLVRSPFGIILVTGPTGCGKTTTMYATLAAINSMEKNIVTIEDPVEYELPLIRQTQVNPKIGLTFAKELRAILRQDPDIIMVGEMRDLETAEVAVQAALTGHLVLSTLHTNDAPSSLTRLVDMGIKPFLIPSTVIGILAQRLIRLICNNCKEQYTPAKEILEILKPYDIKKVYRGKGCAACNDAGFLGRAGVFEFLIMNEELKHMVLRKSSSHELRKTAIEGGMKVLYEDGMEKVKRGVTSIEEVLRVTEVI